MACASCIKYDKYSEFVHLVKIDLNCNTIEFHSTEEKNRGTTVTEFASLYNLEVAINGGFFNKNLYPFGFTVGNGKVWNKYSLNRPFLACDVDNKCWINGANDIESLNKKLKIAISGSHIYNNLDRRFVCFLNTDQNCISDTFTKKHPRTVVAFDNKKNMYIIIVEGRQEEFEGMNMSDLTILLIDLNIQNAINLDGGGSSVLVIDKNLVSRLPNKQKFERVVANHFGLKYK